MTTRRSSQFAHPRHGPNLESKEEQAAELSLHERLELLEQDNPLDQTFQLDDENLPFKNLDDEEEELNEENDTDIPDSKSSSQSDYVTQLKAALKYQDPVKLGNLMDNTKIPVRDLLSDLSISEVVSFVKMYHEIICTRTRLHPHHLFWLEVFFKLNIGALLVVIK